MNSRKQTYTFLGRRSGLRYEHFRLKEDERSGGGRVRRRTLLLLRSKKERRKRKVKPGTRCQSSFLRSFFSSMTSPLSSIALSEPVSSTFVRSFSSDMSGEREREERAGGGDVRGDGVFYMGGHGQKQRICDRVKLPWALCHVWSPRRAWDVLFLAEKMRRARVLYV